MGCGQVVRHMVLFPTKQGFAGSPGVHAFGVKTAGGSLQGNLPMTTGCQSRSSGLAEGESNPSLTI